MISKRANLDDIGQNSIYVIITVILIILSIVSFILFYQLQKTRQATQIAVTKPVLVAPTINISPSTITPVLSPSATSAAVTAALGYKTFVSDLYHFNASYQSTRQLYQDVESGIDRFTFFSSAGNITLHVGTSWSWQYPDRQFSPAFTIAKQPTFIYEADNQTIFDFIVGTNFFTIQCVHQGLASLKTECHQFLVDFKII